VPPGQWLILHVPFVLLGALLTLGSAAISVAALLAVRRRFSFKDLRHEVIASYMEMFGVVYAVLLAFVVFAVWETHEKVQNTVESEAVGLNALYYLAEAYPPSYRQSIQSQIIDYAHTIERGVAAAGPGRVIRSSDGPGGPDPQHPPGVEQRVELAERDRCLLHCDLHAE